MDRFIRNYELIVTLPSGDSVLIQPEIRIQFEAQKSIYFNLNSCSVKIYNLSEDKRKQLIKDKMDTDINISFLLKAGYDRLQTIFKGNVLEAYSVRAGADIITTIKSLDGAYGYANSYTSKTIKGGDIREHLSSDLVGLQKGYMCKAPLLFRPRVLVGNTLNLYKETLRDNENLFIDEEKVYVLQEDEVVDDVLVLVNAKTGLLGSPIKRNKEISFTTLINPAIRIGGLIKLESSISKNLNGIYKVYTIKYRGDNYGQDWIQEVICRAIQNYKVAK